MAWTGSDDQFVEFVDRHGLTFPSLSDDAGDVYARFGIPYQPAFALVRPDGEVETILGAADDAVLDMIIGAAVG